MNLHALFGTSFQQESRIKTIHHPARIEFFKGKLVILQKKYALFILISKYVLAVILLICISLMMVINILPLLQEQGPSLFRIHPNTVSAIDSLTRDHLVEMAENRRINDLRSKLDKQTPKNFYLVINTTENKFRLYSGKSLIREGICSTGSYTLLMDGNERKWKFETPKGIFKVQGKKTNPVWKKPDWAFVEEGLPIPSVNHPSRFEYGTLGDYALMLGNGYMIHGTIYQRFLGLPVTHGCVRMGDEDLELVYNKLKIGSTIYIY
ncbi:MAG: L,D-transpeptidase [Bacteroidales bacterium]|nr:L,D-transpeptidase [Bacteroidales bacterium]